MNEEIKELLNEINTLKTKLAVIDFFINSFKEQDDKTIINIDTLKEKVNVLDNKISSSLRELEYLIETKITLVETRLKELDSNVSTIKTIAYSLPPSSNLVNSTLDITPKKWAYIIVAVISIIGTFGGVDTIVSSSKDKNTRQDLINQIEELIQYSK